MAVQPILGGFYFVWFMCLCYMVLMNVFVTILNESIAESEQEEEVCSLFQAFKFHYPEYVIMVKELKWTIFFSLWSRKLSNILNLISDLILPQNRLKDNIDFFSENPLL